MERIDERTVKLIQQCNVWEDSYRRSKEDADRNQKMIQGIVEYCEKCIDTANKAADKAETPERMNLNMGAVLAYSSVIAEIRRRMKNEDNS